MLTAAEELARRDHRNQQRALSRKRVKEREERKVAERLGVPKLATAPPPPPVLRRPAILRQSSSAWLQSQIADLSSRPFVFSPTAGGAMAAFAVRGATHGPNDAERGGIELHFCLAVA